MTEALVPADRWRLALASIVDLLIIPLVGLPLFGVGALAGLIFALYRTGSPSHGTTLGCRLAGIRPVIHEAPNRRLNMALTKRLLLLMAIAVLAVLLFTATFLVEHFMSGDAFTNGAPNLDSFPDHWMWHTLARVGAVAGPICVVGIAAALYRSTFVNASSGPIEYSNDPTF